MTRPLADVLDAQRVEERRRALRALLRHPLLTSSGPDEAAFRLVRKHGGWLRERFATETGWSLLVDTELARLRKVPASNTDSTRPATSGAPPSRGRRSAGVAMCWPGRPGRPGRPEAG